jgi:hypothetical protein
MTNVQEQNKVKQLCFSGPHIEAKYVENVRNYAIQGRTIVINPHTSNAYIGEAPRKCIPPFSSTILKDIQIEHATSLILLEVKDETNIGNCILEAGWDLYGNIVGKAASSRTTNAISYPLNTPLWRSLQDEAGRIEFDPAVILGQKAAPQELRTFLIKVNLWFSPSQTNCFIHNQHDFIEIHSQIYGHGRMQKFKAQDYQTIYEDLLMSPGYTTPVPFCSVQGNCEFIYPWHQYYADTDCIWLAIEYHPELG